MPRSNLQNFLTGRVAYYQRLAETPKGAEILRQIAALDVNKEADLKRAAKIISFEPRAAARFVVDTHYAKLPKALSEGSLPPGKQKLRVLATVHLPKLVGWRSVAECADTHKIHRNTIESILQRARCAHEMLLACDHRFYISPRGEQLVQMALAREKQLERMIQMQDLARRYGVQSNHVAAFYSQRGITLIHDLKGNARLTAAQVELFLRAQNLLYERRQHRDRSLDGEQCRSVNKVAYEKIALWHEPGTRRFKRRYELELQRIKVHAKRAGMLRRTPYGPYVSQEYAQEYLGTIRNTDAARLLGVSQRTVSHWCAKDSDLRDSLTGRDRPIAAYGPLVASARERFVVERPLSERPELPSLLLAYPLYLDALRIGAQYNCYIRLLPLAEETKELLQQRRHQLPRALFEEAEQVLSSTRVVSLPKTALAEIVRRCTQQGIPASTVKILLDLGKPEEDDGTQSLTVAAATFKLLHNLACMHHRHFLQTPCFPAAVAKRLLREWCPLRKLNLDDALRLLKTDECDRSSIKNETDLIRGDTALKIFKLLKQDDRALERALPRSARALREGLRENASSLKLSASSLIAALPISPKSRALLTARQGTIAFNDACILSRLFSGDSREFLNSLERSTPCCNAAELLPLIEKVASVHTAHPAETYATLLSHLSLPRAPRGFNALTAAAQSLRAPPVFPIEAVLYLNMRLNFETKTHPYTEALRTVPKEGDILIHRDMSDFGPIREIAEGRIIVDFVIQQKQITLAVPRYWSLSMRRP